MTRRLPPLTAALLIAAPLLYFTGLAWNLPSPERADLVIAPEARTDAWIGRVAEARKKIYSKYQSAQANIAADIRAGKRAAPQEAAMSAEDLLHYYSGFLIRSGQEDEPRILVAFSYIKPGRFEFNPHLFMYGGPLVYSAGAFTFVAAKVLRLARLEPGIEFYYKNPGEMRRIFTLIRLWAAILALGVVAVFYGVLVRSERSRFAAAMTGLLILAPFTVTAAHTLKPHLLMCAFFLLAVASALQRLRAGPRSWTWAAGAWAGLAMGTSMSGLCVWFFLLPLHLAAVWKKRGLRGVLDPDFLGAAAVAVVVYLAVNPYVFASWDEYVHDAFLFSTASGDYVMTLSPLNFLRWAWIPVRYGLSPVLWAAGAAALLWGVVRGNLETRLLAGATLVSLFWFGATAGPKWAVPSYARIVVPVSMMTLFVLDKVLNTLASRRPAAARAVLAVLLLAVMPFSLGHVARFLQDNPEDANMMRAGRWINANVPKGASIGIWNGYLDPESMPPFRFADYKPYFLTRTTPDALGTVPDYFILGPMALHDDWKAFLDAHYRVKAEFDSPVFLGWHFRDEIYYADFPLTVYERAS